jgi:hypothetical protein
MRLRSGPLSGDTCYLAHQARYTTAQCRYTSILAARSRSHAQDCQSLWVERNLSYKNASFCFKHPRAIKYFWQWRLQLQ